MDITWFLRRLYLAFAYLKCSRSHSPKTSSASFAFTANYRTRKTYFRTSSRSVLQPSDLRHLSHDSHQSRILADHQGYCHQERKYFDSGDYALSKAGKATDVGVTSIGSQHPLPENIPHLASPGPHPNGAANGNPHSGNGQPGAQSGSPVKESSFLHRETSVDDPEDQRDGAGETAEVSMSPPAKEGVPVRWQQ